MQLLALSQAKIDEVISLALAAHPSPAVSSEDDAGSDDSAPAGDLVEHMLHRSPERVALGLCLNELTADQLAELIALMWLGRGDAGEEPADFPNLVMRAKSKEFVPNYVASKAPLARYLRDGLRRLKSA